ncbi:dienelactone hydrolase family protein [Halopseudomonas nanhaiensis]|uniref:dienelactone hydrolase family protein n=1 Tax=Halopseudomonas nanhaiensis TaxID=2830842 RepID=UPI001CBDF6B4|nr:dienelactone hydrolase family protein [Halopseudomonas nanhaiensis]UAW99540.1 dienelactone hydrolase family protein [Halopseudomonas nanhaiensis]
MKKTLSTLMMVGAASAAQAEMVTREVAYEIDGEAYEGMLVYDDAVKDKRPGLLMVPNWMGVTENSAKKAFRAGGSDYVVFIADMYGKDIRPSNTDEAAKAATTVRSDRQMMRKRVNAALDVFRDQADSVPLDVDRIGAIGFCFGGGTVLELARSGTDVDGVVSFHGNLDTPDPVEAGTIQTPVLVLHGAIDPFVPDEQVRAFEKEMREAEVDWTLISYGGAVHSFTDPTANMPGKAEYHPVVAERAFGAMRQFFNETMAD